MVITYLIIFITAIVSFLSFYNLSLMGELIFDPYLIQKNNQWYRFLTSGFIHADINHLFFNMLSLYMFGGITEGAFKELFGNQGATLYLILYLLSIIVAVIPTFFEHRSSFQYRSLGASGGVSAIVFAGILFYPNIKIGLFILPPIIPGYIFGPIYLAATIYLGRQGKGNINHSAHFWGAAFGIVFVGIACFAWGNYNPFLEFYRQITGGY